MTTIVHKRETGARNLINLGTHAAAEEFLDGLTHRYQDTPGMRAERTDPNTLTVTGKPIGETPHIIATYTIQEIPVE